MIKVYGSARRTFNFPADLPTAYAYCSDVERILTYLPHIFLVQAYAVDQFRMLYSTLELGVYRIRIFCDLRTTLDVSRDRRAIHISPLTDVTPVVPKASLSASVAQGYYASSSVFHDEGKKTRIDFSMTLQAKLPTPLGLRLMPASIVNGIAGNITNARIHEITNGFIQRSIDAFPYWLEEMQSSKLKRFKSS
jgi:hypothetical protein